MERFIVEKLNMFVDGVPVGAATGNLPVMNNQFQSIAVGQSIRLPEQWIAEGVVFAA